MKQMGYNSVTQQLYDKITEKEEVTRIAQKIINGLCDFIRKSIINHFESHTGDIIAVNFSTTYIKTFLLREKNKFC